MIHPGRCPHPALSPCLLPAAPAAVASQPLLVSLGLDRKALVDVLGIDETLAVRALAAADENALMALAENAVEWQGLALLDLATGSSVAEVQDKLSLGGRRCPETATEDDRLIEGLRHPAAQMSFAWIENNAELRRVIEGGDFGAWRVFLHPEQRKYAERSYSGPFRLSGGAGTGKTVVLLHRARMLARRSPGSRVLLTTFTTNLADQLRTDLGRLDPGLPYAAGLAEPGVSVYGIDALASAVLRRAGAEIAADAEAVLGAATTQVNGRTPGTAWRDAVDAAGGALPAPLRSIQFLAAEYAQIVLAEPDHQPGGVLQGATSRPRRRPGPGQARRGLGCHRGIPGAGAHRRVRRLRRGGDHRGGAPAAGRFRRRVRSSPITCSWTRGRTSVPRTGSSCGRWPASTRTTCSSPRTRISASTASGSCCRSSASASSAGPSG